MSERNQRKHTAPLLVSAAALSLAIGALGHSGVVFAQAPQGGGGAAAAAPTPQAQAPIDLTGNWVSVVTEDWRWRMVTPPKGDYSSVPLNPEGRRVADTWDPAKDTADGNACRSYGAAAIMRVPGRLQISWQDPNTLKIVTDAGQQTRLLHFGEAMGMPPAGDAGWQGYSAATWEFVGRGGGAPGGGGGGAAAPAPAAPPAGAAAAGGGGRGAAGGGRGAGGAARGPQGGDLKVETSHMKAGYLRKNGVPYSQDATMTEYFDRHREPNGDEWFTVTTVVHDPKYLMGTGDFITSTHFKKEPDASKFRPTPCTAS